MAATAIQPPVGLALIAASEPPQHRAGADGRHLMTDVWTSVGVVAGVALVAAAAGNPLDP